MVERRTPERVVDPDPHSCRRVVSLSKIHLPPRKWWLRPDITEKLFTGTLSKNETKRMIPRRRSELSRNNFDREVLIHI